MGALDVNIVVVLIESIDVVSSADVRDASIIVSIVSEVSVELVSVTPNTVLSAVKVMSSLLLIVLCSAIVVVEVSPVGVVDVSEMVVVLVSMGNEVLSRLAV